MQTFPIATLRPASFQLYPFEALRGSGASLADLGQEADWSGGGHWLGEMKDFSLTTPAQHLAWRGLMASLRSGVNDFILPIIDFCHDHLTGGDFSLHTDVETGDTEATISNASGKVLLGGEYFTLDHPTAGPRTYVIESPVGAVVSGHQTVGFSPPIRENAPSASAVDFMTPRLVVRLQGGSKETWAAVTAPFKSRPSLMFVESFRYLEDL